MDGESTESRLNADGNKEILAPAEGPRENLITTAVKFLQNPKVMSSPLYQKKAFLEKKGLTQQEINIAIQRAGVKEVASDEPTHQEIQTPGYQPGLIGLNPQAPPGYYLPIPAKSGWARARDLTMSTIVVASVSYAVYQLFQKYLRPIVLGKSSKERRLEKLQSQVRDIEKSVTDSLAEMNKTLQGMQQSLNQQHSQISVAGGDLRGISDLKADIASLKGLLLNKNQFPPAPTTSPILPSWQRAQTSASAATASPSYADVVKTSAANHSDDISPDDTSVSASSNSLDPILTTIQGHASNVQENDDDPSASHSDFNIHSPSESTDSDSSPS